MASVTDRRCGYVNGRARSARSRALVAERRRAGGARLALARRPRRALGRLRGDARPARLGGRVRRARRRRAVAARRRRALWKLGSPCPASRSPAGTQLALPLEPHEGPELRALSAWERMLADYGSTGVTLREHPLELMRPGLPADLSTSSDLETPPARPPRARGRPRDRPPAARPPPRASRSCCSRTSSGTINLIVPPPVHDRFRLAVRSEPLVLASGRLEAPRGHDQRRRRPDRAPRPPRPAHAQRSRTSSRAACGRATPASWPRCCRRRTASAAAARHHPGPMAGRILVGTSSWADPGFVKEWYPPKLPAKERLPWYAQRFELVELNSSFYAVPDRNTVHGWVEVTPPGFTFDVKAHRALSRHSAPVESLPPDLRELHGTPGARAAAGRAARGGDRPAARRREVRHLPASAHAGVLAAQAPARGARHRRGDPRTARPGRRAAQPQLGRATTSASRRSTGSRTATWPSWAWTPRPATTSRSCRRSTRSRTRGSPICAPTAATREGYLTGRSVAERFAWQYTDDELAEIARARPHARRERRRGPRGVQQQPRRRRAHGGAALPRPARPGDP